MLLTYYLMNKINDNTKWNTFFPGIVFIKIVFYLK